MKFGTSASSNIRWWNRWRCSKRKIEIYLFSFMSISISWISYNKNKIKYSNVYCSWLKLYVDVCCLQKTKIEKRIDIKIKNNHLICFLTEKSHYGNDFSSKSIWKENIHRFCRVSERICVLQLKMMKHQDFISKLDGMKMKITKTNANRCKSRLDGLKIKIHKVEEKYVLFMHQQQLL